MLIRIKSTLKNRDGTISHGIVTGIVALYISVVIYLSIWDTLEKIALFPFLFAAVCYILTTLRPKICSVRVRLFEEEKSGSSIAFYITIFLIIFAGQMLYWMAYYPGGFNLDAYGQWDQVHGLQHLNNWHPVFTTACYWIITRLYDSFAFCIFVQLLIFSLSISYLLLVLYRLNIHKALLVFAALYISLNPAIGMNNVCLFKDVPFTIALIWMTIILVKTITTKGVWLKSISHSVCIVANLVAITLIRHNGIFYIIPVLLCIALIYRKQLKSIFAITLAYILALTIIQGPIYSYFAVEEHSNLTGESVGIPMALMANNFVSDTENTPDEVEDFLLAIADKAEWEEKYILGEWDSCKWDFGGIELFQGESLEKIIRLAFSSMCASPETAYQSVRENTRVVWQVLGTTEWITWVYIEENDYGICEYSNSLCSSVINHILDFSTTLFGTFLCWNIGVPNIILVFLLWIVVVRKDYQKITLIVPTIAYNILTMLLLCGPSHRYFYFNSVLILPIVLSVLYDNASYDMQ